MDMPKKTAKSHKNARLNPDIKEEERGAGDGDAARDERTVACPQPNIQKEKPLRIIFISTTAVEPVQARQLPWEICGNATPNKTWLGVIKHYRLLEIGETAYGYCEDEEHPGQFIHILHDIQGLNITPDAADQIELINDNQVNA